MKTGGSGFLFLTGVTCSARREVDLGEDLAVYHQPIDGVTMPDDFLKEVFLAWGYGKGDEIGAGFGEDASEIAGAAQGGSGVDGDHFDGLEGG